MELYCLRHGVAADPDAEGFLNDAERALTAEGKRKMRAVAASLLFMASLHAGRSAYRFTVRNFRSVQLHLYAIAPLQTAHNHFHVLLPIACQ